MIWAVTPTPHGLKKPQDGMSDTDMVPQVSKTAQTSVDKKPHPRSSSQKFKLFHRRLVSSQEASGIRMKTAISLSDMSVRVLD